MLVLKNRKHKYMAIKIKNSILAFSLLLSSVLYAQESGDNEEIKKEVQVVQEYNPIIFDAFKLNEMPSQEEEDAPALNFNYQITGKTMLGAPEVVPLLPAKLSKSPLEELFPAYAKLYLGNYNLIGGGIKYNLVQQEKFVLALKLGHESSFGKLKLPDNTKVNAPYHDTDASLFMRHFVRDKIIGLDLNFDNYSYQYYGMNNIDSIANYYSKSPFSTETNIFKGSDLIENNEQYYTSFGFNLGFMNRVVNYQYFAYKLNFDFNTFGNGFGFNENRLGLNADLDIPFGDYSLALLGAVNHAASSLSANKTPDIYSPFKRNQTLVQLNPAMMRRTDKMKLKMGLRLGFEWDDLSNELYISPDVQLNVNVVDEVIALEGGIKGNISPSYYDKMMKENPFISPDLHVRTAFEGIDLFFGVVGNFSRTTSFAARVNYISFINEHFYKNRAYLLQSDSLTYHYNNVFDIDYDDGTVLKVSGELKVDLEPDFDIVLKGTYYNWELDSILNAWHKPQMEVGLRANYYYDESLSFFLSANVIGKRYAYIPNSIETLKPVYDFNIGSNYRYNKRWHFFAEVRNIAAGTYYRWYGYPSFQINARVGAGFSF